MDDALMKSKDIAEFAVEELRKISRFGAIGLGSNALLYVAFLALLHVGLSPVISAGICYITGVALSYVLNRGWTFRSSSAHRHDLPRFFLAYAVGFVSTLCTITALLYFLEPELAQILNIAITALVVYTSLRALRFGTAKGGRDD